MKKLIYLLLFILLITGCEIKKDDDYQLFLNEIKQYNSFNKNMESEYYQNYLKTNSYIYSLNLTNYPDFLTTSSKINEYNGIILVNKNHGLKETYIPDTLTKVQNINYIERKNEEMLLDQNTYLHLKEMFEDATNKGIDLCLFSGYRSFAKQLSLWDTTPTFDNMYKAVPGYSEHQTGLCCDISTKDSGLTENKNIAYEYLAKNAHLFGFILRYPKNKENITGYNYEPWHYRYVGNISNIIYEKNLTLEEYIYQYIELC